MNGYRVLWDAKILHHDLKLENVLIKDGKYKLSDFGFSIFYEGVKQGSVREGTLQYMPL
jgi:serine/threonine protein kinase